MNKQMYIGALIFSLAVPAISHAFDQSSPPDSLVVASDGNVGVGTNEPSLPLHVKNTENQLLLLENTATNSATRRLMKMTNNGPVGFEMVDNDRDDTWQFRSDSTGKFVMNKLGNAGTEFNINGDGDAIFAGEVRANGILLTSSRASKTDISAVKASEVMDKLKQVEIAEWRYKQADKNDRHISPMAEDFYSLFKLGRDGKTINPNDLASVAIVAAKELQNENELLKARLESLEKMVLDLSSSKK